MWESSFAQGLKAMLQGAKVTVLAAHEAMDTRPATILIVEDHITTRRFLADNLSADGYEPLEADSAREAGRLMAARAPDLAIIDLGLPDRDGLELLREVRQSDSLLSRIDPNMLMLVLSGRGSELDRVRGFEFGADDYLRKPFSYPELRGRVGALLRRAQTAGRTRRLRIGPLELDPLRREVRLSGASVHLSKKEYALLRALAEDPTRVFTREELLRGVWGYRSLGTTRTLDSHASRLRKKLSVGGAAFVVNVWGVGYRLVDGGVGG